MTISETELRATVKTAMAEALLEQRALLREIIEEVIEDIALSRAIYEGMKTPLVPSEDVFAVLDPR